MKVKVSKQELRECVEGAVLRIVKEGKELRKFRDNDREDFGEKPKKHNKLDKGFEKKQKGGANKKRWQNEFDDED